MTWKEGFQRTPKYVVWPCAAVLSYGIGYLLAFAAMFGVEASLSRWLALETEWCFTAMYLVFCVTFAAAGTVGLTWILRWHHWVSSAEIAVAIPLCLVWPVWITHHDRALLYFRPQAAVGWFLFSIAMFLIWKLCMRIIRAHQSLAPQKQENGVMKAGQ